MLFLTGCFLAIEMMRDVEPMVLIQYQSGAIAAGFIVMNVMACRTFRSLRQFKPPQASVDLSVGASDVLFYTTPRQTELSGGLR